MSGYGWTTRSYADIIATRRSIYDIADDLPFEEARLEQVCALSLEATPWAEGVRTGRLVILLGRQHQLLWELAAQGLSQIEDADEREAAELQQDASANGYGTLLVCEDEDEVRRLQERHPSRSAQMKEWSQQSLGILQAHIWGMLEELGAGVSLQHHPLPEGALTRVWGLPTTWRLVAQMPFGSFNSLPAVKQTIPGAQDIKVFR